MVAAPDVLHYTVNNQANVAMGWEQLSKMIKDAMAEYTNIKPNYERDSITSRWMATLQSRFTQRISDGTPTTKLKRDIKA